MSSPLPSIRSRIVFAFVGFGLAVSLLVMSALVISSTWQMALFALLLIFLLLVTSGWHIGGYVTRDLRRLTQSLRVMDPATMLKKGPPLWLGQGATSKETRELVEAFETFSKHHQTLIQELHSNIVDADQEAGETASTLRNFMYHVAHTLRTPLNAIRWTVETLKTEEPGDITGPQRELLDKLEYSSVKLLHLADELQDTLLVARGEPLRLRPQPSQIVSLVDTVAGNMAVAARKKGVRLKWEHPKGTMPQVVCDEGRTLQVLLVLVDNAVRYTPPGGEVEINLYPVNTKLSAPVARKLHAPNGLAQSVIVEVHDTGMGITAADQKRIFQPFFRGQGAKDLWVDGKGIGLTIARAIVQQSGGSIWFWSKPNNGTHVCFSLPAIF